MGRLERRQAGAVSFGVLGVVLLLAAVVMTVAELNGRFVLVSCICGTVLLLSGVALNSHVSDEMIRSGRR